MTMAMGESPSPSVTHEAFREPALVAAARMRFRPAKQGGRAVATRLTIPVQFRLSTGLTFTPTR